MSENENGRPGKGGPESSTATGNTAILPPTGCPCGCLDEPCVTDLPIPRPRACWDCAAIPADALAKGYGCRPEHSVRWSA